MIPRLCTSAIALILIVSIILPSTLLLQPRKAEAVGSCIAQIGAMLGLGKVAGLILNVPVRNTIVETGSFGSFAKDCILEPLVTQLAKAMLYNITVSTVEWINSGFEGNPGFVQDFEGLLKDSADDVIGDFISKEAGFLCSPFSLQVRIALAQTYMPYRRRAACTLSDVTRNIEGFIEGNNDGGWDRWLEVTTVPQNNAWGAFVIAQDELSKRIFDAQKVNEKYLDWGRGFRDFEVCETQVEAEARVRSEAGYDDSIDVSGMTTPACEKTTPGAYVQERLSATLNIDLQQLAVADNINAILDALANQITKQIITGAQGLLGSRKKSSGGGYGSVSYEAALAAESNDPGLSSAIDAGLSQASQEATPYFAPSEAIDVGNEVPVPGESGADQEQEVPAASRETGFDLVSAPLTISRTNQFSYQISLATNYTAANLSVRSTLRRNGSIVPFSSAFTQPFTVSTGRDGFLSTYYISENQTDIAWNNVSAGVNSPFVFKFNGMRNGDYSGTYSIETVAVDVRGKEVARRTDNFLVQ